MTVPDSLQQKMHAAFYAKTLGFKLQEVSYGYARVSVDPGEQHRNFMGGIDGGLIMSLADYAFACSCNTFGDVRVAAQFSTSFIAAPEEGKEMIAEGRTIHAGKKVAITEITVTQGDRLIARATGTAIPTGRRHE